MKYEKKPTYQKPTIINLSDQTVYGARINPLGQCQPGGTAQGGIGCQVGNAVQTGECLAGTFPTIPACSVGSNAFSSNHCNSGGDV